MSAQDKTEQVLREMHIMYANSEVYDKATNRVIIDKKEALNLLQRLNVCIYELMEEHELTQQSRDAAERQQEDGRNRRGCEPHGGGCVCRIGHVYG